MRSDFHSGVKMCLPLAPSVMAYGSVLGMLAAQKGLTWTQLLTMNVTVFAGSAQFIMVEMWNAPLPIAEMALAVVVINLRYMLIGASLAPMFQGQPLWRKLTIMHVVADENWAVAMAEFRRRPVTPWFLLGGGLCLSLVWSMGTLAGLLGGGLIANPEAYALDFAFVAIFTALTVGLWRGKKDVVPWLAAGLCALFAEKLLPGKWHIVIGGLGGALAAMCAPVPASERACAAEAAAVETALATSAPAESAPAESAPAESAFDQTASHNEASTLEGGRP